MLKTIFNIMKKPKSSQEDLFYSSFSFESQNFHPDLFKAILTNRSFDSMSALFAWMIENAMLAFSDFSIRNKNILEIGTGTLLNHPLAFKICGASSVTTIDKYQLLNLTAFKYCLQNSLLARRILSKLCNHDEFMFEFKKWRDASLDVAWLESQKIFYKSPFEIKDLIQKFDIVYSYTVLEHLLPNDLHNTLSFLCEKTSLNGYQLHYIDLEDHKNPINSPFDFLYEDSSWNQDLCITRGNRVRFNKWKEIFNSIPNMLWKYPYVVHRNDVKVHTSKVYNEFKIESGDINVSGIIVVGKKVKES